MKSELKCEIKVSTHEYLQQRTKDTGLSVGEVIDTIVGIFQDTMKEGE